MTSTNLNIIMVAGSIIRLLGFPRLGGLADYRFTDFGFVLNPVEEYHPGCLIITDGVCEDAQLARELMERGFTYGTMLFSDGAYIGLTSQDDLPSLEVLVDEFRENVTAEDQYPFVVTVTAEEAAELLEVGLGDLWELAAKPDLDQIRSDRRQAVLTDVLQAWLEKKEQTQGVTSKIFGDVPQEDEEDE